MSAAPYLVNMIVALLWSFLMTKLLAKNWISIKRIRQFSTGIGKETLHAKFDDFIIIQKRVFSCLYIC